MAAGLICMRVTEMGANPELIFKLEGQSPESRRQIVTMRAGLNVITGQDEAAFKTEVAVRGCISFAR